MGLSTLSVAARHALATPRCYTSGRSVSYDELERPNGQCFQDRTILGHRREGALDHLGAPCLLRLHRLPEFRNPWAMGLRHCSALVSLTLLIRRVREASTGC